MMLIEYAIAEECGNYDALYICLQCGGCGRVFNDYGEMISSGGTTPQEELKELYD